MFCGLRPGTNSDLGFGYLAPFSLRQFGNADVAIVLARRASSSIREDVGQFLRDVPMIVCVSEEGAK
jgi:hypothetical protein